MPGNSAFYVLSEVIHRSRAWELVRHIHDVITVKSYQTWFRGYADGRALGEIQQAGDFN